MNAATEWQMFMTRRHRCQNQLISLADQAQSCITKACTVCSSAIEPSMPTQRSDWSHNLRAHERRSKYNDCQVIKCHFSNERGQQ